MLKINAALMAWVHNLTSSPIYKTASGCTITDLVHSSWPIANHEAPKSESELTLSDVEKIANTDLIQTLTVRFSHNSPLLNQDYICKVYQDGSGSIIRTITKPTNFTGKICAKCEREAAIIQKTGRGGMLPSDLIRELDSRQVVFMPQFLTDAIEFLKDNKYYNILITLNGTNTSKSIAVKTEDTSWLEALDNELHRLQLDPNELTIMAERKPNRTDLENLSIVTDSKRRMAYKRTITREGADRSFGQSADTLPLGLFSEFAHNHFEMPTNDAFVYHVYNVCDSMYTHPVTSVAMF